MRKATLLMGLLLVGVQSTAFAQGDLSDSFAPNAAGFDLGFAVGAADGFGMGAVVAPGARLQFTYERFLGESGTFSLGPRFSLLFIAGNVNPGLGVQGFAWFGSKDARFRIGPVLDLLFGGIAVVSPGAELGLRLPVAPQFSLDIPLQFSIIPGFTTYGFRGFSSSVPTQFLFSTGVKLVLHF